MTVDLLIGASSCKGTSLVFFNLKVGVIDTVFRFKPAFADTVGIPLILDSTFFMFSSSVGVIDTVFRFEPAFADTDGIPLILDSTPGFCGTISCIGEVLLIMLVSVLNFWYSSSGDLYLLCQIIVWILNTDSHF